MKTWRPTWTKAGRNSRRGVLTLEWILLISVVVIGIIAGLGAVRDALLCELKDLANCITALNINCCDDDPVDNIWFCQGNGQGNAQGNAQGNSQGNSQGS